MPHSNCKLAVDNYGNFFVAGAKPSFEEDGNWDATTQTYYEASVEELASLNAGAAQTAIELFGKDVTFTTAMGSLIVLKSNTQVAHWLHNTWVCS